MTGENVSVPIERIERLILLIRGQKVMLDADLAALYGVETKVLVQAVKRNISRFPDDFMFQLTKEEFDILRSQTVTSSSWGGRRYPPYAFTEQGVAMLSSVLRSKRAVQVNIQIMRTFETSEGVPSRGRPHRLQEGVAGAGLRHHHRRGAQDPRERPPGGSQAPHVVRPGGNQGGKGVNHG